jgi:DNA modification methylase
VSDYRAFLEAKIRLDRGSGFEVALEDINPALKPHTRAIVQWALRGGRRAIFAAFGLHKTATQLEIMRLIGARRRFFRLIVMPLGVRQEFFRDARERFQDEYSVRLKFIRRDDEIEGEDTIYLTNYESAREGLIDLSRFTALSLDEAAVLRSFGSKTFGEMLFGVAQTVEYRFVATATPDPNEYLELIAYAHFLGIMDMGESKTRFFKRNSEKADQLTLRAHKEEEFWLWVASWAIFVQKPSDLGFSDDGYSLPNLDMRWHELPSDHNAAGAERNGQGRMFRNAAIGVGDAAKEKRESLPARVARTVELVLNAAQRPSETQGVSAPVSARLLSSDQGDAGGGLAHLSAEEGLHEKLCEHPSFSPDGEATTAGTAAPVWGDAASISTDPDRSGLRMPDLHEIAGGVDGSVYRSFSCDDGGARNPVPPLQCGARIAGGQHCESGKSDRVSEPAQADQPSQTIVWCELNDEQRALERAFAAVGVTVSSLYGSQSIEEREQLIEDWRSGRTAVFLSKTSMYGAGMNLQQSHRMVFVGVHFKFYEVIQGVHRIHRFGQEHACSIDLIYTEAEREVRRNLEAKWARYKVQAERMSGVIREYGLSIGAMTNTLTRSLGVTRTEESSDAWHLVNDDCVEYTQDMPADSVGLILTSIPFSTQYEYTPSYNDFGHTDTEEHFYAQMDFLSPQLLRVLKPGRVLAVHCKDRVTPGAITGLGFQTITPFHAEAIRHFRRHGFAYMGMKTIVTDVVRENNQTYRLGWTEQCKDGSRMGCGLPEYLLLFRKPPTDSGNGYADERVIKAKADYTRARWQFDAHGFMRSAGDRLLAPEELRAMSKKVIYRLFRKHSSENVYSFEKDLAIAEAVDAQGLLPPDFMLLPPTSWHPDVWTDITRMRTLNGAQAAKGREMHLCPLQFDICDRTITQYSNPEDLVFDPFSGLGTVPLRAVKLGRRGLGVELNAAYHADAVFYLQQAERESAVPALFDLEESAEEVAA